MVPGEDFVFEEQGLRSWDWLKVVACTSSCGNANKGMRILMPILRSFLQFVAYGIMLNSSIAMADERIELDKIVRASLNQVRLIRSIQFTANFETRVHLSAAAAEKKTIPRDIVLQGQLLYVEAGGKYRIESAFPDVSSGTKDTEVAAFNGDRYQLLYKEKKGLTTKKTPLSLNPSRTLNPLLIPYVWLLNEHASVVLSEIKNEKYWNERFAKARYVGKREENGVAVEVVEFPSPFKEHLPDNMQDSVVQVHFAAALGYYPIATIAQTKDGRVFGEFRVNRYKEFPVDGEKVVIPLELSQTMNVHGGPESTGKVTIVPETIKLNQKIDEDFFTISPTLATIVEDADKTDIEHQKLEQEHAERLDAAKASREAGANGNPPPYSRTAGIVFTCAVIVFLIILVFRQRTAS